MLCLTSSKAYCQRILVDGESLDTTICFTIPHGKFLLKQYYQRAECNELLHICETEKIGLYGIIGLQDSLIARQERMIENNNLRMGAKNEQIKNLQADLKLSREETKRQKTLKYAYLFGGGIVSVTMGYFLLR